MDGGLVMSFLDDSTLLFADSHSIKVALDTRDGVAPDRKIARAPPTPT